MKYIDDYYNSKIRNIYYDKGSSKTINDFYDNFVAERMPSLKVLEQWHDLLVRYIFDDNNNIFFIRKYESKKTNGVWDTRRGAVVRFKNGIEIVYSSNFLAHDIFLMAYNDFCPTYEDFVEMVKTRKLKNTIGTDVERDISLYPGNNRTIKCYLAHLVGVNNDKYLSDNNNVLSFTRKDLERIYPLGTKKDWGNKDRIYKLDYILSQDEFMMVKAHTLRLLDPFNYFPTPQTKHSTHSLSDFNKNIGEYGPLINYIIMRRKKDFGAKFEEFLNKSRYVPFLSSTNSVIDFCYDANMKKGTNAQHPKRNVISKKSSSTSTGINFIYIPEDMGAFRAEFLNKGKANIEIIYLDGSKETKAWTCNRIGDKTNIKGNLTSKAWYRKNKNFIKEIKCIV